MIEPFITSNTPSQKVLLENFGITFYYAQILEDNLKLILAMAELQGLVVIDRKKDLRIKNTDEFLIEACMGNLKEVLKKNFGDDEESRKVFDEANVARRLLAHRFFLEHAKDFASEAGLLKVNEHLSELYIAIRGANEVSIALQDEVFKRVGFTPEIVDQKLEELRKAIS